MTALIYGGSGSGKSAFAERMICAVAAPARALVYIATMSPEGDEAKERIVRHRAARADKGFTTLERRTNLAGAKNEIPPGSAVLLECLGNLAANELFHPDGAGQTADAAEAAVLRGLEMLSRRAAHTVIVANDVFADGAEYPEETTQYMNVLASLHKTIAARATLVVETVCGIPLRHKDDGGWPL